MSELASASAKKGAPKSSAAKQLPKGRLTPVPSLPEPSPAEEKSAPEQILTVDTDMYSGAGVPETAVGGDGVDLPASPPMSPAEPSMAATVILRKQQAERGMDLEAIFNTSGVPVMLHKFRKALLGGVGCKPRLLTLSSDATRLFLVKRPSAGKSAGNAGGASSLRASVELEDEDLNTDDYSFSISQISRIVVGADSDVLSKSLKKRDKAPAKVALASARSFTIVWRDPLAPPGSRGAKCWDLEVDTTASTLALGQSQAVGLQEVLVSFLIEVAALGSMGSFDKAAPPDAKAGSTKAGYSGDKASVLGGPGGAKNPKAPGRGLFSMNASSASKKEERPSNFRARKLSITGEDLEGELGDDLAEVLSQDGGLYMAKEMLSAKGAAVYTANDREMPFDSNECGTYSCHGIEPKFTRNGFQVKAKINQDRGGIQYPFGGRQDMAFFCVMDGHGRGGEKISEYCMTHLPKLILAHKDLASNPGLALRDSFIEVDHDLGRLLGKEATYAGTTCVVVLVVGDKLVIANSGDSRAVVGACPEGGGSGPGCCVAKDLSFDHKPNSPEETKRVLSMGGWVSQETEEDGPSRVWLGKAMNSCGLAMARSLGDHALAAVGVIAEPEITLHTIRGEDRYLILGSDGIWEFISSQQACDLVHGVMQVSGPLGGRAGQKGSADKACRLLIERSSVAWKTNEGDYRDDITGIVVALPCFEPRHVVPMTPKTEQRVAAIGAGTKF